MENHFFFALYGQVPKAVKKFFQIYQFLLEKWKIISANAKCSSGLLIQEDRGHLHVGLLLHAT